jgi:hypothetical protein
LGGCLLELPCETDDALQQKIFFVNIFPKKVGERAGGGGGGEDEKNFFRTFKKITPQKIFQDKKQLIKGKKIFFGETPPHTPP